MQSSIYVCAAALLLGLLFAQAMTSIPRLSITFDEDVHITTGYSILRTGDLRLVEDHPPLLEMWMSWPLLLSPQVPDPWEVPTWELGDRRLFVRNEVWGSLPIDVWSLPPRIPIAWLALLLGAFLYRWASDWFGPRAGLFALALFVFDPNILAHATLATLDLGLTCLMFVTMYGVWRSLHRPTWRGLVMTGISLGLTLATKISAAILIPVSVGLLGFWALVNRQMNRLVARLGVFLGMAALILCAVHLFGFGPSQKLAFSLPAPTYWNSLLRVAEHVSGGDWAYLLGKAYQGGRWYFFPVALALKTPLPTLLLLGASLLTLRRRPLGWQRVLVLASLPVSYLVISVLGSLNLGYRHILPILPFIYLFIASLTATHPPSRITHHASRIMPHPSRLIVLALLLWQAFGALRVWPFHLTFFNEIAGGSRNGYRYMTDSNVDWGQGLKALRNYLEAHSWPDVRLSSFVFFVRPEQYGIQATPLPPLPDAPAVLPTRFDPAPGTYVISASTLRGLQLADHEMYNWFWHREPDDVVANAMLVYHVTERESEPAWLGQCTVPVTPLSPDAVAEGFGRSDLRMLAFDCTQSWIYPNSGKSAGWYVLHRETAVQADNFTSQRLASAQLGFEQKIPREIPPLTVFEWEPQAPSIPSSERMFLAAPVEWPPVQVEADGVPVAVPIEMDGPMAFLGYEAMQDGRSVTLVTYWQVVNSPDHPFSLMGHLVGADAIPVAVGDGLGVPWDQLRSDDLVVQRHALSIPQELPGGSYWLQTGAYWSGDIERWNVLADGAAVGDRILLTSLEIP
jgi:hypothetical protein